MIERDYFAKCVGHIEKMKMEYGQFADILSILADTPVAPEFPTGWIDTYVALLSIAMDDQEGWINWYVWDSPSEDKVVMVGEREWSVNDAYDLYDLIMEVRDASSSRGD